MVDALLGLKWLTKAARVLLAALLVATVADLLGAGTSKFSWGTSDSRLSDTVSGNQRQVIAGEIGLTIRVKKQQLTARYRVVLPRNEPLFEAVQRGKAADDPLGLIRLLGPIEVAGNPITFRAPSVAVGERALRGTITLATAPVTLEQRRTRVEVGPREPTCCLPPSRIVVTTSGAKVLPVGGPAPLTQSTKQTTLGEGPVSFDLLVDPFVHPGKHAASPRSAASTRPASPDRSQRWGSLVQRPLPLPGSASLTLEVSKQVLTAVYELTIDRDQGLLDEIENGQLTDRAAELVNLLGGVTVDDKPLRFDPPLVSIDQDRPQSRITLRSEPQPLAHPRAVIKVAEPTRPDCCRGGRSILIKTAGAQVQSAFPHPVAQSAERTMFGSVDRVLYVGLLLAPFDADLTERQQVASLLRALNQYPVPVLGWALYWATMSLPLLLFLLWHQRRQLGDPPLLYTKVTETLFAFLLVMLAGSVLAELALRLPLALWVAWTLHGFELQLPWVGWDLHGPHWWPGGEPHPGAGGPALILLAAGFVWPLVAWRRDQTSATMTGVGLASSPGSPSQPQAAHPRGRRTWRASLGTGLAALAPLLLALLVVHGAFMTIHDESRRFLVAPLKVALWSGVAALVLAGLLLWLSRELDLRPPAVAISAAIAAIITLALLGNVSSELRYPRSIHRGLVTVVCFALAASLLRVVVRVAARPLPEHTPAAATRRRIPDWMQSLGRTIYLAIGGGIGANSPQRHRVLLTRVALALLLLVVVLPNPRWSGQQFEVVSAWYAQHLADWLIHVVYLTLGIIIVLCLSDLASNAEQPASRPATRYLCFLLLVMYVLDPSARIFFLPVTLAIGWLSLAWLLPKRQAALVDSLRDVPRPQLVQAAVVAGRERRAYKARRKDLLTKVGSGDITRAEYRRTLDLLSSPSQAARVGNRPAGEVGMLLGPHTSPWANGLLMGRYSFWVSVPWVLAVYLRQEVSGVLQGREFLVVALLLPLISSVLQWPVIGFVFGYLYPFIRGANGLWKALSVAGALIVPSLLLNLAYSLIGDNDSWPTFLYWALQVFVTCVSTGFLADLATLRKYGRGQDELTDVHNFSALAAWGSSVVAASAGGLVTLLSSTIGEFLSHYTTGAGTGLAGR
jgi:hypothetical protein